MPSHPSLRLISTDFDGTIHLDNSPVPIPDALQDRLAQLQAKGVVWAINTGREMASLMESLARARARVRPDYLILVEREIYRLEHGRYVPVEPWHTRCHTDHQELFSRLATDLEALEQLLAERFDATFYADPWSPLCAIARSPAQLAEILGAMEPLCRRNPELVPVWNDIYVRLSHRDYSKGTALAELARLLGVTPAQTLAAGDHANDLPMLDRRHAHYLVAPVNAIPDVRQQVAGHAGFLATAPAGHGLLEALDHWGFGVAGA